MKFAHVTSIVLSALSTLTLAASAHAGGKECLLASLDGSDVATMRTFVDDAMETSIVEVMNGGSGEVALAELSNLIVLESQMVVYTEAECLVLQRLQLEIADLRARAERWAAREVDLFQLRQEIFLARIERAVSFQEMLWHTGAIDSSTARSVISALHDDVFATVTTPQFNGIRARLAEAIETATKLASNELARMQAVHHFYTDLYLARYVAAQDRLFANDVDGSVTIRDYERVGDASVDLFTLIVHPTPYACGS